MSGGLIIKNIFNIGIREIMWMMATSQKLLSSTENNFRLFDLYAFQSTACKISLLRHTKAGYILLQKQSGAKCSLEVQAFIPQPSIASMMP